MRIISKIKTCQESHQLTLSVREEDTYATLYIQADLQHAAKRWSTI